MSDRPFNRRAVKLAFQIIKGRHYAHAQDWWPHLAIIKPAAGSEGSILWKDSAAGSLTAAKSFLASFHSQPIIFGSGPSLRGQDLSRVSPNRAILLNGAINLIPDLGEVCAVVIEDERFVWRHHSKFANFLPNDPTFLLSPAVIRALLSLDSNWCQDRTIVLLDNLKKPCGQPRRSLLDPDIADLLVSGNDAALSTDPEFGVVPVGTVAFSALQFALAAGVSRIGLGGIDLSNADMSRFYENGNTAKSGILRAQQKILTHFALADEHAKKMGVDIVCHSPVSALRDIGIVYQQTIS